MTPPIAHARVPLTQSFDQEWLLTERDPAAATSWCATYVSRKERARRMYNQPLASVTSSITTNDTTATCIPFRFHYIWINFREPGKNQIPPSHVQSRLRTWQHHHPDAQHSLWLDDAVHAFLTSSMVAIMWYNVFHRLKTMVCRVDLLKLLLMWYVGGFYADADLTCFQSWKPLFYDVDWISPASMFGIARNNAFVGATPKHPFTKQLLQLLLERHDNTLCNIPHATFSSVLYMTGPLMWQTAYQRFRSRLHKTCRMLWVDEFGQSLYLDHLDHSWFAARPANDAREWAFVLYVVGICLFGCLFLKRIWSMLR